MITEQIAERRAKERALADAAYWQAVNEFAIAQSAEQDSGLTQQKLANQDLDRLQRVIEMLGRSPKDFDDDVDTLRLVRITREQVDRAAAQAKVAGVQQLRDKAAGAEERAKAARTEADRAAAEAQDVERAARKILADSMDLLSRGNAMHTQLLARGCPSQIAGAPCFEPAPPPPTRRYRALQQTYVNFILHQPGEVFDTDKLVPADVAEPVAADAVTETMWPWRATERVVIDREGYGPGDIVWLPCTAWGVEGLEKLTRDEAAALRSPAPQTRAQEAE